MAKDLTFTWKTGNSAQFPKCTAELHQSWLLRGEKPYAHLPVPA